MDYLTIFLIIFVAMVVFGVVSAYMIYRENKRLSNRLQQNKWKRLRSSGLSISGSQTNFKAIQGLSPTPSNFKPMMSGHRSGVGDKTVDVNTTQNIDSPSRSFKPWIDGYKTEDSYNSSRGIGINRNTSPIPEQISEKDKRIQAEMFRAVPSSSRSPELKERQQSPINGDQQMNRDRRIENGMLMTVPSSHSPESGGRQPSAMQDQQQEDKGSVNTEMLVVVPSTSGTAEATGQQTIMVEHARLSTNRNNSDEEDHSEYEPDPLPPLRGHPPPPAEYFSIEQSEA